MQRFDEFLLEELGHVKQLKLLSQVEQFKLHPIFL
jgi:hypothetical protein